MNPFIAYRKKTNITQGALAKILGIPQPTLCAYEKRHRYPDFKRAFSIEDATAQAIRAYEIVNPLKLEEATRIRNETIRPDVSPHRRKGNSG